MMRPLLLLLLLMMIMMMMSRRRRHLQRPGLRLVAVVLVRPGVMQVVVGVRWMACCRLRQRGE